MTEGIETGAGERLRLAVDRRDHKEIETRFTYHAPKGDQAERYVEIRGIAKDFAIRLVELCPASQERDTAIKRLEEAVMWANASIARREP